MSRLSQALTFLIHEGGTSWKGYLLTYNTIKGVDPCYHRFPCLTSLSLNHLSISALDLNLLLTSCPKIEILYQVFVDIAKSDAKLILCSSTLKYIFVDGIRLDKFAMEAYSLEIMDLKVCILDIFEFSGKGSLKEFRMDDVINTHLDIGESFENLEVLDIENSTIVWPNFYQMISRSTKLRDLRLWEVRYEDQEVVVEWESIAICFPDLSELYLSYDLNDKMLQFDPVGTSALKNVILLEVGSITMSRDFSYWIEKLPEHCPNLKKLIMHGTPVLDMKSHEDCQLFTCFTCSMVRILRNHSHVELVFMEDESD